MTVNEMSDNAVNKRLTAYLPHSVLVCVTVYVTVF